MSVLLCSHMCDRKDQRKDQIPGLHHANTALPTEGVQLIAIGMITLDLRWKCRHKPIL